MERSKNLLKIEQIYTNIFLISVKFSQAHKQDLEQD